MPVATSVDGPCDANFSSSLLCDDGFEIALNPRQWEKLKPWGPDERTGDYFDLHRSVFYGDSANRLLRCLVGFDESKFVQTLIDSEESDLPPVVFHGESGTGKSTLATLLSSQFVQQMPTASDPSLDHATYFTGSDFYRFYLAANERQNLAEFRQRILDSKGILIDDLDQLAEKYAAQRELIFLIDQMLDQNKPVIVTMKDSPWAPNSGILQSLTSRPQSHPRAPFAFLEYWADPGGDRVGHQQASGDVPKTESLFRPAENRTKLPKPDQRKSTGRCFNVGNDLSTGLGIHPDDGPPNHGYGCG